MNDINIGAIVERVVRRSGLSVTELARRLHVNRRTIYNWFSQRTLNFETVHKIGCVLGHDFSVEFPEIFHKNSYSHEKLDGNHDDDIDISYHHENDIHYNDDLSFWINKYIKLLEKFTQQLEQNSNENITKSGNNGSFYDN